MRPDRQILTALQRHGPLSRADLARRTGVSGPTVTRAVASLLTRGLVEEGESQRPALGRPGKELRLARTAVAVVGVVIGVRRCELVAAGLDGEPRLERTFDTPPRYTDLVSAAARGARELAGGAKLLGVGVSVPGLLNRRESRTVFSPNLHLTDGRQLGEDLRRRLGVEVTLVQEAQALCLAEQTFGAARGVGDFAMLDISDGLGLGVVLGGKPVEGHSGLAGELGHITVELDGKLCGCGNRGCLETVATDAALAAAVSERIGQRVTVDEVVELVRSGKLPAGAEFERLLQYLAVGLAAVVNVFNPQRLFVHGRCLDADERLWDRLLALAQKRALAPSWADCTVVRAKGNKRLGALAAVIRKLVGSP